jgi:hypothetical protein
MRQQGATEVDAEGGNACAAQGRQMPSIAATGVENGSWGACQTGEQA